MFGSPERRLTHWGGITLLRRITLGAAAAAFAVAGLAGSPAGADQLGCASNLYYLSLADLAYVEIRDGGAAGQNLGDYWVYLESNGAAGLQHNPNGGGLTTLSAADCNDGVAGDTIVI